MENTSPIGSEELAVDAADQVAEAVPAEDEVAPQASQPVSTHVSSNINDEIDNEPIYADASHWMHSVSADGGDRVESGIKINLTDIDLTAIEEDEVIPDKGTAHSMGRKLNIVLCAVAFVVLFGYLFIAGEGEQTINAFTSFNYGFLLIALVGIVVYWLLEALSMQLICNELFSGFSFIKTFIVTIIGQYFNCITPLSSGGQPMQAYYYTRFGLPIEHAMPMLLCRFIVYQMTMTVYAIIVLILRFEYFMQDLRPIMYLVAIGFLGGFVLMAMLLALAFAKNAIISIVTWAINLLGRIGILKNPESTLKAATKTLEEAYDGMQFLLKRPSLLLKVSLVTFVQLTVYFSLSWVIFAGLRARGERLLHRRVVPGVRVPHRIVRAAARRHRGIRGQLHHVLQLRVRRPLHRGALDVHLAFLHVLPAHRAGHDAHAHGEQREVGAVEAVAP